MEVKFLVFIMEISLLLSNCSLEKICSITFAVDYKENPFADLSAVDITILLKTLRTWYGRVLTKYCCCGSVSKSCTTLWDTMNWSTQASLSFTVSRVYTDSCPLRMRSNHCILCCPLLLLPSFFLSIRVFSSELALHIR